MKITEHFSQSGDLFFRLRGHLPLVIIPIILLSFVGINYPFGSHRLDLFWEIGCFIVAAVGVGVRVAVGGCSPAGTSGRNRKQQRAEVLNTTGLYSVVRHPLYLGNFLIILGIAFFTRTWFVPLIVTLAYIFYYERIMFKEEEFLEEKFGNAFCTWAQHTPLVIPRLHGFQPSALPFLWRAAVRKECYAVFGVAAAFFAFDVLEDYLVEGRLEFDPLWTAIFAATLIFFLTVRLLRKTTHLLHLKGR